MWHRYCFFVPLICFLASIATAQSEFQVRVIAEGLYHPVGMALLPDGGVLDR